MLSWGPQWCAGQWAPPMFRHERAPPPPPPMFWFIFRFSIHTHVFEKAKKKLKTSQHTYSTNMLWCDTVLYNIIHTVLLLYVLYVLQCFYWFVPTYLCTCKRTYKDTYKPFYLHELGVRLFLLFMIYRLQRLGIPIKLTWYWTFCRCPSSPNRFDKVTPLLSFLESGVKRTT